MAPARSVTVKPFLCARAPVLDRDVRAIDAALAGRCPLEAQDDVPDLEEPFVPDDEESDLDSLGDEDRAALRPAFLTAAEVVTVTSSFRPQRLLRAAEWEYVARRLGTHSWIAAPSETLAGIARSVEALKAHPTFTAGKERDLASNELGIWALHVGEWVTEDQLTVPRSSRGGSVLTWPWQDSAEVMFAHPAARRDVGALGQRAAVRLAVDLP